MFTEHPRYSQSLPEIFTEPPRDVHRASQMFTEPPRCSQSLPDVHRAYRNVHRASRDVYRASQRCLQSLPKCSQSLPRSSQSLPEMFTEPLCLLTFVGSPPPPPLRVCWEKATFSGSSLYFSIHVHLYKYSNSCQFFCSFTQAVYCVFMNSICT